MTAPLPPVGEDQLVAWLREHEGSFTEEALLGRLLAAGHPATEVDAAFARLRADAPASPSGPGEAQATSDTAQVRRERDAILAFFAAVGAIVGIPALLVANRAPDVAVVVAVAGLVLSVVGWAIADGARPGVATGLKAALVVAVLTPVIAFVGLFGYCLVVSRVS